ncbi:MAG TPA: RHS repeat-associated core domain-containing protein [Luteibacter sp.]|jgi:RHS repeat-associated protein|uniref:RHS repeat-associated core domain-containing protein n=1 Tax=Luteibacter sp. TaxID=1886636 RepID=UPI002F3FA197
MKQLGIWAAGLFIVLLVGLGIGANPAQAQNAGPQYGPPYYFSWYDTSGPYLPSALSLNAAIQEAGNALTAKYGTNVTATQYVSKDGHTVAVTIQCHIQTRYFNSPGSAVARVDYGQDDGYGECSSSHGFLLVYPNFRAYDIGKNAGGCDCDSGNGNDRGDQPTPATAMGMDPVNTSTGNKYLQDTDFKSPSPALTFRRFYNSISSVQPTSLGTSWRHSFDRSLSLVSATQITLFRPDGRFEQFVKSSGAWKADADVPDRLTEQDDPTGVVTGYTVFLAAVRETEQYSSEGLLQSVTTASGLTTTFTYSTSATPATLAPKAGLLLQAVGPDGRMLAFAYNASGLLTQVTLPDGQLLQYAYDTTTASLIKVQYPDGKARQYLYDESSLTSSTLLGLLTGVIDESGKRFESTTYDSSARAISTSRAAGVDVSSIVYGTQSGSVPATNTLTTPLGTSTNLSYKNVLGAIKVVGTTQPCGEQCTQPWQAQSYDANGYPTSRTNFNGATITTVFDTNGLLTRQVEATGTADQRNTSRTWDTALRVPLTQAVSNAKGIVASKNSWSYNARGQVTAECAVDPAVTVTYACGSQAHAPKGIRQTRYTYCDAVDATQCPMLGLLLTKDGPRTDVTDLARYSYYLTTDEAGCGTAGGACHRAGDTYQVIDAAGHVSTTLAYDKAGRVVRQKDANGVISDTTYTPRGWLASRTVRASATGAASNGDATTTLTYTYAGLLETITDPDGVTWGFTYDDAQRLVDIADAQGGHIRYTLDAAGNRIKEETFDAAGTSRRSVLRAYNKLGQLISLTDGLGHVIFDASASGSYDANGNLVSAKDAVGTAQKNTFDALDRLVSSVADANGTNAATKATTIAFTLNALDQAKSVTDPDGLTTTYSLDGLSNATGQASPDTGARSSTFDAAGNPLTQTDAKAIVATQAFDALDRRTSASYADSKLNIAFHYDEANSVTGCASSFPVGRLTRVVETGVTTVYCYDNQGRITEQRQTQSAATDTTDYVYTKAGRLAAIASPSGLVTEYGRDTVGQVTKVTVTPINGVSTVVVSAATYLPFGPLASYALGNGQTVTRSYDANYRFTDVVSPALSLHVARDAVGNIVALGNAPGASPAVETYSYDALYRLTGLKNASGAIVEAYSYSKTGDRLTKTAPGLATGNYGYQSGTHQLTSIGTGSRTYDANGATTGNATAGTAWGYGYNGRGQLTVLQQGGATVATYAYDAAAHRIAKSIGAVTTRFAYGSAGMLGEYGAASRDYVWMDDTPVAVVDGSTVAFVHADGLNTPRAVTSAVGAIVWGWAYQGNPFGEQVPTSTNGYVLNLRFPGQYYDAESGIVYNVNRYFDASTGRYLQSDPIGLAGGLSTYGYVAGNPLGAVDPQGLAQQRYRADDEVVETPQMKAAYNRLTDLATQAANTVDATCGARCLLPWIRGTLIHSEFKRLVDSQCPQSMYHTEVTYKDGVVERYGLPGSSRADVVFGPQQQPIAVFDLKTGRAYITISQGNAYGANLPVGTPISEIHPVEP